MPAGFLLGAALPRGFYIIYKVINDSVVGLGDDCASVPDVDPLLVGVDLKGLYGLYMAVHETSRHCASMRTIGLADVGPVSRSSDDAVKSADSLVVVVGADAVACVICPVVAEHQCT